MNGHEQFGELWHELGATYVTGSAEDGCKVCGADWDDDKTEPADEPEPEFDTVEEMEFERRLDEIHHSEWA